ncbi:protein kinase [Promicromonospora vindobonensis]|uniref:non-specific serine/threonine protein kinase n=1 Tax=Promicromonospora vindobonensis TaxID=195748 RepID=A0ABW5VYS9_9MICO
MARIVQIGPPVNDAERTVIAHLRDHGPDDWTVVHSLEIPARRGDLFELDLVVVTGHMVYVIDVKGTRGRIEVHGDKWLPAGRAGFHSPLPKVRANAKRLKSLLEEADPTLSRVYVGGAVVLPAPDARLVDRTPQQQDAASTVHLDHLVEFLADASQVPIGHRPVDADISGHHDRIVSAVEGPARAPSGPLQFGNWHVLETLSETQHAPGVDVVGEYRAKNANAVQGSGTVRLVVRQADPYAETAVREKQQKQIGVAYEALGKMPSHPNIVGVRDFFPDQEDRGFVTVYDDVPGHGLRLHLGERAADPLTLDQKLLILRQVLQGLAHAQARKIVHRSLSPSTILVTQDGRAMLTGFDYAKTAQMRSHTVRMDALAAADVAYVAQEAQVDATKLTAKADIYAVGVIGFELFTGRRPFESTTAQAQAAGILPEQDLIRADVPASLRHWLSLLCATQPEQRPNASEALRRLELVVGEMRSPRRRVGGGGSQPPDVGSSAASDDDERRDVGFWKNLPRDYALDKYLVRERLGKPGGSGVAYRVFDTMRNVDRVLKLILQEEEHPRERARREAAVLERLSKSEDPHVVKMIDVSVLPPPYSHPYLVFEHEEGKDLGEMTRGGMITVGDVLRIGRDVAAGLRYLHGLSVWHCDVKPSNLLWTEDAVKLIDFGIAKTPDTTQGHTASTPRYTPPDLAQVPAGPDGYVDRDLYALGITLYEALTGGAYPWEPFTSPPPGKPAPDPRRLYSLPEPAPEGLVTVILKAVSPLRSERFTSAHELLEALDGVITAPQSLVTAKAVDGGPTQRGEATPSSVNRFVEHLQTLYSQSHRSNRGTRGIDDRAYQVYVNTALDEALRPAVFAGQHGLVIVTGNAGDGKTAFLESLEEHALDLGAQFDARLPNGSVFTLSGRRFRTNYDGSQDEENVRSDDVLVEFFSPFAGSYDLSVPRDETRLIAINEGRLVDFLTHHRDRFEALAREVDAGLRGEQAPGSVAIVNLNLRDVTVQTCDDDGVPQLGSSILERMLTRMTDSRFWDACDSCPLVRSCYARHNATTIAHPVLGPQVADRLRRVYELAQLRGRLHITVRDLRSALAYTLTSGRNCAEIQDLHESADDRALLDSYYFNAYRGGDATSENDRLLVQLRNVDVAGPAQPVLDRRLASEGPLDRLLIDASDRPSSDRMLLRAVYERVVETGSPRELMIQFVATARRLLYFEMRDVDDAVRMLPYNSARAFLDRLMGGPPDLDWFLRALNRSEGVVSQNIADESLVVRVRDVSQGTVRSLRRFPATGFTVRAVGSSDNPYVESRPTALRLTYVDPDRPGTTAAGLQIGLDLFELLGRFDKGYQATADDDQGYALALSVFKNQLAAVPYQEVVLTIDGSVMHTVRRSEDGVLHLTKEQGTAAVVEELEWH